MDISVIVPVNNGESYLRQTLDSILSQKFCGEWELVVSDDNSSDNSSEIIQEFIKENEVRIQYNKNIIQRGYVNYAVAARLAKGKYLAFCDQDDLWTDALKLQKQFDFMESHPDYGMTCSNFTNIGGGGGVTGRGIQLLILSN